jgi:hypothetical protein
MQAAIRGIISLGIILALLVPGATAVAAAGVSVSPNVGVAGTATTVSGNGFAANVPVRILFNGSSGTLVSTVSSDGSGNFSASFTIPNARAGTYQIFATDGSNIATTSFTVPLSVRPASGRAGRPVSLSGTGFSASEQVNLAVDGGGVTSVASDGNGNFVTTLQLSSSLALGAHTISATGASSGHSASVTFQVTSERAQQAVAVACTSGDERHGNGFGDENHCHTGSQGHHGDGNDNDQGEDS